MTSRIRRFPKTLGLRALLFLSWICVASFPAGCDAVKPWQRETLSESTMQSDRNPQANDLLEHVYASREAAKGGRAVGGGGCGCN